MVPLGSLVQGWTAVQESLPHLHLHTEAVEEVSSEGQAVHGRECGVYPA